MLFSSQLITTFTYLPRYKASPKNTIPMASAMTIPKGLNIATYTGPFFRHAHTFTTFRVDITKIAYKSHKITIYNHKIRSQVPIVQTYILTE